MDTSNKDVRFDANGRLVDANAAFLKILQDADYAKRTRLERPVVVFEIIEAWKKDGGRFLLQQQSGEACELADKKVREYLGRILRRQNRTGSVAHKPKGARRISTQLDYARDGVLYGRDVEQKILQEVLRMAKEIQIVVISGRAGVGKTALAHSLQGPGVLFAQGKFEQPFHIPVVETALNTALVDVITTLVRQLSITEEIREKISNDLDPSVLQSVFPAVSSQLQLSELSSDDSSHGTVTAEDTQGKQSGKVQVLVMTSLLKMVATTDERTIVLQIDDLQWADEASLDVLTDLLDHIADIPNILLLFTDREEANQSNNLKKTRFLEFAKKPIHRICLKPLSESSVSSLLSALLNTDESKVESLSDFFFTKTEGNASFVCELLRKCQEEDAFSFDEASKQWKCNEDFVSLVISECDDIVELFSAKVQSLPAPELQLLKAASCLGSTLDEEILQIAVQLEEPLKSALRTSIAQRLIAYDHHRCVYRFAHDNVHRAVYKLLEGGEREAMHLRLGKQIFGHLERTGTNKAERLVDVGLSQLIRGKERLTSHGERVDVAKLCLEVGQRAFLVQGFNSSSAFLQHAISLLGERKWQDEYDLCLKLHNTSAEVAYCTGKLDVVQEVVDEVLRNTRCFDDSLGVRATKVYSLGSTGSTKEAIELGLETLRELGVNIPISPSSFDIRRSNWTTRRVRKASHADILCLPFMNDKHQIAAMQFMNLLMFNAWKFNPKLMSIIIQKMVVLTMNGGLTSASAPAFGWYGALLCLGGDDIEAGYRFGKLSLQIYDKFKTDSWLARVTVAFYGVVSSWKDSAAVSLYSLKSAYQVGIGTGDIEYAVLSGCMHCWNGREIFDLDTLDNELSQLMSTMNTFGQQGLAFFIRPLHQMVKNFVGTYHEKVTILSGEILDKESTIEQFQGTVLVHWVYFHELVLAFFFQDYDKAEDLCTEIEPMLQHFYGAMDSSIVAFYHCLALLARRPSGKKKRNAIRLLSKIRRWALHSPVNFLVKQFLLEAELARVEGNRLVAVSKYSSAILHAKEGKFIMVEGLANERAGRFYLEQSDFESASKYLQAAVDVFRLWGGASKVHHMITEMQNIGVSLD